MAHEMGHYVLGHSYRMIYYFLAIALGGFLFVHFTFGWASRRFGAKWDIKNIGDIAGMPLFFALFAIYSTAITPVQYNIIRSGEVAADEFGLDAAREPDGFATTALRLSTYRELEPEPWEEFLFRHHPSGASRVRMAMEWKERELAAGATDIDPALRLDRARAIFAESPLADTGEDEAQSN
jgi:STE24 endopeptidase